MEHCCGACGKTWNQHLGVMGLCAKYRRAINFIRSLRFGLDENYQAVLDNFLTMEGEPVMPASDLEEVDHYEDLTPLAGQ